MCGIVGYIGHQQAYPYLIEGLKKLEYRGYDSAGIAFLQNQNLHVVKKTGKVALLEQEMSSLDKTFTLGIGHTRWATHGVPSDMNAHPHSSNSGKITLVHNGIIENYAKIKENLVHKGFVFHSETDSEVLVNYIEDIHLNSHQPLDEAIRLALREVTGAYVILLIDKTQPDTLYAARKGSPMVIGIGDGEYYIGSDASPMLAHTKDVIYINDNEFAIIKPNQLILKNLDNEMIDPQIQTLTMELSAIEKGGYDHYMIKEIHEQPKVIQDSLRNRIDFEKKKINLDGMEALKDKLLQARRVIIVACGTSWHAGLLAEYWIEELCRLNVEVEYASEFRYRNPIVNAEDVIIAISQSGETADTLVALESAKAKGATIIGVVNVVGSSIARISDAVFYTHAGPEIGVASTKAFTAQLTVLLAFAIQLADLKNEISTELESQLIEGLGILAGKAQHVLDYNIEKIKEIAKKYHHSTDFLFLGRSYNFPIALEGALKLKEISYIHAEGYPAAEMKHGPIALVDESLPVVFVAPKDRLHEKIVSNMQEIKARAGQLISVITEEDNVAINLSDDFIIIPDSHELIAPILANIPLQLLSYYIGIERDIDVDKPRNLAKSVTVE